MRIYIILDSQARIQSLEKFYGQTDMTMDFAYLPMVFVSKKTAEKVLKTQQLYGEAQGCIVKELDVIVDNPYEI